MTGSEQQSSQVRTRRQPIGAAMRRATVTLWLSVKKFWRRWKAGPSAQAPAAARPPGMSAVDAAALLFGLATIVLVALLFDEIVVRAMRKISPEWRGFFVFVTGFGKSGYLFAFFIVAACIAVLAAQAAPDTRTRAAMEVLGARASYIFVVLLVSGIASQVLKRIGRGRPRWLDDGGAFQFNPLSLKSSWASMPSGHTITAFAFVVAIGYFLPRWRAPLLVCALLIGVSRVAVGAHYPADVVAGACIGIVSAVWLRRLFGQRGIAFRIAANGILVRGQGLVGPGLRRMICKGTGPAYGSMTSERDGR